MCWGGGGGGADLTGSEVRTSEGVVIGTIVASLVRIDHEESEKKRSNMLSPSLHYRQHLGSNMLLETCFYQHATQCMLKFFHSNLYLETCYS